MVRVPTPSPRLTFIVGVFVLAGALVAGISALQYEFYRVGTTIPDGTLTYAYGDLTAHGQRVVDAAIRGQRFTFDSTGELPGVSHAGFGGRMGVTRDGASYLFARQTFFAASSSNAVLAFALTGVGFLLVGDAVRRAVRWRR